MSHTSLTETAAIDTARTKQMAAPGLAEPAKKALATLNREWDGLTAHRDYPMIGLDNNKAKRTIRGPVVTRKNTNGSHNADSARHGVTPDPGHANLRHAITGPPSTYPSSTASVGS